MPRFSIIYKFISNSDEILLLGSVGRWTVFFVCCFCGYLITLFIIVAVIIICYCYYYNTDVYLRLFSKYNK